MVQIGINQIVAFLSQHMDRGLGVFGLSGMQVNALLPFCTVRIAPSFPGTTIVAFFATSRGAAFMALAINCASVSDAFAPCVAE